MEDESVDPVLEWKERALMSTCDEELLWSMVQWTRQREKQSIASDLSASSNVISRGARAILIDWLVQVQHHLRLLQQTLYIAISLVDRYTHNTPIVITEYQLLGITAIFVATKMEERYVPEVADLVLLTENTFTKSQVVEMEKKLLLQLKWVLWLPEASWFVGLGLSSGDTEPELAVRVMYLLDLMATTEHWPRVRPSLFAFVAIALVFHGEGMDKWKDLERMLDYERGDVEMWLPWAARLLLNSGKGELRGPFQKYNGRHYAHLSTKPWTRAPELKALASGPDDDPNNNRPDE